MDDKKLEAHGAKAQTNLQGVDAVLKKKSGDLNKLAGQAKKAFQSAKALDKLLK